MRSPYPEFISFAIVAQGTVQQGCAARHVNGDTVMLQRFLPEKGWYVAVTCQGREISLVPKSVILAAHTVVILTGECNAGIVFCGSPPLHSPLCWLLARSPAAWLFCPRQAFAPHLSSISSVA